MKKEIDLENLTEEELTEYLAANQDEDLIADPNTENAPIPEKPKVLVREEEIRKPQSEIKKEQKAELKVKKAREKALSKKIRKHKKAIKKNPTTLVRYDVDPAFGLPNDVVEERYLDELVNVSKRKRTNSIGKIIIHNAFSFFNFLIYFIAAILITLAVVYKRWEPLTDLSFFVIVSANIIIGIIQEVRAKKMIESLSLMNETTAVVKRNGIEKAVSIEDVVLDDLLILSTGNQICADSVVVDGQIEVNESLLTGESDSIIKKPGDKLFSGSFVVSGKCGARVDKIGKDNYIEGLASQARVYKAPNSDLYKTLNRIIIFMFIPVIVIGSLLFLRMYLNSDVSLFDNVRKTAGAMIGMIPSGLFLMSSIALYVGVIRLGQRNVLVQELYCIEMLARVDCICLDKTGTITDGTMTVKNVIDYDQVAGLATKNIISAMLNALPDRNMTSDALIDKFGLGRIMKYSQTIPFSSDRKYQAVTFDNYGTFILGAPEFVLKDEYYKLSKDVEKYSKLGYRVLCLAYKNGEIVDSSLPTGDTLVLSVILIEDTIRPDAISTIKYFNESGVQVRVISGDNPITVSKISQRAGVPNAENYISLDGMTDDEVMRIATKYTIFGRVNPNQKKLLVQALHKSGKTVAMTGDGVNDILALREADCSIALGSGSDATRSCSHLVLLDSNFGSMPSVVSEGRRVINNVSSVASLFLTKTIFSLLLGIIALFSGTYPITPKQLILIEVLAIGIPSLFLVNEPNNDPVTGNFLATVIKKALPGSLVIVALSGLIFALSDTVHLDSKSLTTIIVITATHTSLMVLFKACRPFNTMRKFLCTFCYAIFLFAICLLPHLLEFKPLFKFIEYYSPTETFVYSSSYPGISISEANYYIIDEKITDISAGKGNKNLTRYNDSSKNTYAIDGFDTGIDINIPDISFDKHGYIYSGGYKIQNIYQYYDGIENDLTIDRNGYVYLGDEQLKIILTKSDPFFGYDIEYGAYDEKSATFAFKVIPNVKIENNKYIITTIDGTVIGNGDEYYPASSELSRLFASGDVELSVNPDNFELLVDGEPIVSNLGNKYIISMPVVSTSGNRLNSKGRIESRIYFDAIKSSTIFECYGLKEDNIPISGKYITTYTIKREENGVVYEYVYTDGFEDQRVYKIEEGESLVDHITDFVLLDEFSFEDFATNDYKLFFDKNGVGIDVNNISDPLQIIVEKGKANYSLSQGTNVIETTVLLSNTNLAPVIDISEAHHFIIDGYYTQYEYNVCDDVTQYYYKDGESYYLIIGKYKTSYGLPMVETTGGLVTRLTVTHRILLIMLCLLASPLMKILQYAIPWLNKNSKALGKFLNKW